ncbi:MAG: DUF1552 domain-containing protein [Alphaproteobacteria bacterium]|nr:DUF1552 domain-containing protein [Alphaproteobacteria bacterium]
MSWSRRAVLRGAAATVALPFLPSLLPRAAANSTPPLRLLFFFVPNGLRMDTWRPVGAGSTLELGPTMQGLVGLEDRLCVVSGLDLAAARSPILGDHSRCSGSFLTCASVAQDVVRNGISVDQVAAAHLGVGTPFRSLELGSEPAAGVGLCDGDYPCVYAHTQSWSSPTSPMPNLTHPRTVFDRLFGRSGEAATPEEAVRLAAFQGSVLDAVRTQATALQATLAVEDRHRLDQYLTGLRELEQRVDVLSSCGPSDPPPDVVPLRDHPDVMLDLAVAALACDRTRVVSYMLANAACDRVYDFLPGVRDAHHQASHHEGDEGLLAQIATIDRWEVDRFARLLRRMDESPLGTGTLLDHSLVVFGSGISDGNRHAHDDLPVIVAGGGGGAVAGGRHLVVPSGTPLANLHTSILQAAGVATPAFADATGPLEGLAG